MRFVAPRGKKVFPLKKRLLDDPINGQVVRAAHDTRPIALKLVKNKVVASAHVHVLAEVNKRTTSELQRGFVPGRQLLQNIVEIDCVGRVHALRCMRSRKEFNMNLTHPDDLEVDKWKYPSRGRCEIGCHCFV